jgi:hypothetical protein
MLLRPEMVMANEIPVRQNELVDLVRASREVYDRAKRFGGLRLILTLLSAVGGPTVAAIWSSFFPAQAPDAKAWAGLFAVAIIVINVLFFEPWIKKLQDTGARIQELFDVRVYEIPWNDVKVGERIDAGTINIYAKKHRKRLPDDAKFLNWYPVVAGQVPMVFARLICQGSSMRWDASLRRTFCQIYAVVLAIIFLGSLVYAMFTRYDMQAIVLSVIMPVLPGCLQIWRENKRNAEAGADMERATQHLETQWRDLLLGRTTEVEALHQARLLQDELFDRRRHAPAIPEQLYQFTRDDYEERMQRVAREKGEEVETHFARQSPANE